jgi:hypothetical protein
VMRCCCGICLVLNLGNQDSRLQGNPSSTAWRRAYPSPVLRCALQLHSWSSALSFNCFHSHYHSLCRPLTASFALTL